MTSTEPQLVNVQLGQNAPPPDTITAATNLLAAPESTITRLRHMPEDVYSLDPESHIVRFVRSLIGDAGVGRLRKSYLSRRLQGDLRGANFLDLDRFYGAIFNLGRTPDEVLSFDPYTQPGTTEDWDAATVSDASYRSRIEQFARAIPWGGSPLGMELAAEAIVNCDCDIIESIDVDGITNKRIFYVVPKRVLSDFELYSLRKVLDRLRPADAFMDLSNYGIELHVQSDVNSVFADSENWTVINRIVAADPALPYLIQSGVDPVEQPRPPFSAYQGEAWNYNTEVVAIDALVDVAGTETPVAPNLYVASDGTQLNLGPEKALTPISDLLAGRFSSDGVVAASPYYGSRQSVSQDRFGQLGVLDSGPNATLTTNDQVYADRIPLDALVASIQSNTSPGFLLAPKPHEDYWLAATRFVNAQEADILEVKFVRPVSVNYVSYELSHFPCNAVVLMQDALSFEWIEVEASTIYDSLPAQIPNQAPNEHRSEQPEHYLPEHWVKISAHGNARKVIALRVVLDRQVANGQAPTNSQGKSISYSLAVRNLEIGYRVTSIDDAPLPPGADSSTGDWFIESSLDIFGSPTEHWFHRDSAMSLIQGGLWRSEPMPIRDAVVNLYMDLTFNEGSNTGAHGQVIDRFYIEPTTIGVTMHIYYSLDDPAGLPFEARDESLEVSASGVTFDDDTGRLHVDDGLDSDGVSIQPPLMDVDFAKPFWFGLNIEPDAPSNDPAGTPPAYEDVVAALTPLNFWRMNGSGTTITDEAGSDDATAPAQFTRVDGAIPREVDHAGTISGVHNITFPDDLLVPGAGDEFSVSFMVNIPSDTAQSLRYKLANNVTPDDAGHSFAIDMVVEPITDTTGPHIEIKTGPAASDTFKTQPNSIPLGEWVSIAVVKNSANFVIVFVDGEFISQNTGSLTEYVGVSPVHTTFGTTTTGDTTIFDELSIFDTALDFDSMYAIVDAARGYLSRILLHQEGFSDQTHHSALQVNLQSDGNLALRRFGQDAFIQRIPAFFAGSQRINLIVAWLTEAQGALDKGWHFIFQPVAEPGFGSLLVQPLPEQVLNTEQATETSKWAIGHGAIDFVIDSSPLTSMQSLHVGYRHANYQLINFVWKSESLTEPTVADYFIESSTYTIKAPPGTIASRRHTDNAVIRYNAALWSPEFNSPPYGFVGGAPNPYAYMNWTPIPRDYELQRGFIHLPPTNARFWKFEFTGLQAEPYESFVPILRTVKQLTAAAQSPAQAGTGSDTTQGVSTNIARAADTPFAYNDTTPLAKGQLVDTTQPTFSPTDGYYAPSPQVASALRDQSWVWSMQPWARLSEAPVQQVAGPHTYDTTVVSHTTKIGYFVGLTALVPYRVTFEADDDRRVIYDRYHDVSQINASNWEFNNPAFGGIGGLFTDQAIFDED